MIRRRSIALALVASLGAVLAPAPATAATTAITATTITATATPSGVWTAAARSSALFSLDGSLVLVRGNSSAGGRIEVRNAATGAVVQALASPYKFTSAVLSADNQLVAAALTDTTSGLPVRAVRLYRVSDGVLVRSIPTMASRDITSLDLSRDGLHVAAMDPFSYERGGNVHVHRVADGSTVRVLVAKAPTATVRFSPDGRYLAANDRFNNAGATITGVRVFRTDTWASALVVTSGSQLVRWSADGGAIWTMTVAAFAPSTVRLVSVPGDVVQRTVVAAEYDSAADVTDDGALAYTNRVAAPRTALKFTDTLTGAVVATYDFGADVFAGDISPDGSLFSYVLTTGPSAYDVHVARMPGR